MLQWTSRGASGSGVALRPALQALKQKAELALNKKTGDVVLFSKSITEGSAMTDLSFENHKAKKRVSMYFTSKPDGIAAYRRCASILATVESVELQYTPQFGQSRISFEWDEFWTMMEQNKLGFLGSDALPAPQSPLQLESAHGMKHDADDASNAAFSMDFEEVKKIE
ncbi:Aste57867_22875 [Aphanomyces stellatus]|uniref:Aste57867_22875 protein n=1 Tax=Aphanomyces stellatus TaxID=120398 RepID=A0A485LN32_9STRA|nr:hypothetical protein As57867_022804 [Aphanomyces stellatus]VFT99525.1 Aste57867_22875 [Aphanomyces stellatus]